MIDKVTTGIVSGFPLGIGYHRFAASDKGELLHFTGFDPVADTLRAIVPPEGWEGYCAQYPEAQSIVDQLRRPAFSTAPAGMVDIAAASLKPPAL